MDISELSEENQELLRDLFNISSEIKSIYDVLIELELTNETDSQDYKSLLSKLKELINREEELYNDFNDTDSVSDILDVLFNSDTPTFEDRVNLFLANEDVNTIIKYRIAAFLDDRYFDLMNQECLDNMQELLENVTDAEEDMNDYNKLAYQKEFDLYYSDKLSENVETDLANTILFILDEYLKDDNYNMIKDKLLEFKYSIMYNFRHIEKSMLNNNISVNDNLYWGSNLIVDLLDGNSEELNIIKEDYGEELLRTYREFLLDSLFEDIDYEDNYARGIIAQIIVRAALLFCDKQTAQNYIEDLMSDLYNVNSNNEKSVDIIINSICRLKDDIKLPNIAILKLKK